MCPRRPDQRKSIRSNPIHARWNQIRASSIRSYASSIRRRSAPSNSNRVRLNCRQNAMSLPRYLRRCGCRQRSATRHRRAPSWLRRHANRRSSARPGCPDPRPLARRHQRNATGRQRSPNATHSNAQHRFQIRGLSNRRIHARSTTVPSCRRTTLRAIRHMTERHRTNHRAIHQNCARLRTTLRHGTSYRCGNRLHLRGNRLHLRHGRHAAQTQLPARTPVRCWPQTPRKSSRGWKLSCQQLPSNSRRIIVIISLAERISVRRTSPVISKPNS